MLNKYIMRCTGPTVGMDGIEAALAESKEALNDEAFTWAIQHYESYGYYFDPDGEMGNDDNAVQEVDYWIEEYDPKKHDLIRPGGGSFETDFEYLRDG